MKYNSMLFAVLASIIAGVFWLLIDNTYDTGDSITHYAIAHYSWKHPYLLFDNWGKPVFTFLSSPFAQLGWKGITFFNSLVGIVTCCLIAQIVHRLKWGISPYAALLLFFIPNYPLVLNSGLTEPLYALILVLSLYLIIINQYKWSAIVISFLPYVRSEGFISAAVLFGIFIFAKKWKELPYFFLGTVIISVAGYLFFMDSVLWLFKTNPYIHTSSDTYGAGNWEDYFIKFYYMTGLPFTILFWISAILLMFITVRFLLSNVTKAITSIEATLLLLFFSFFFAHVVFWKFGLFHSFGMSRVLISVLPIAFIMVLYLLNLIFNYLNSKILVWSIAAVLLIFPFLIHRSSWSIPHDFVKEAEMVEMTKIQEEYKIDPAQYSKIYYSSTPLMIFLDLDVYDTDKYQPLVSLINKDVPSNEKILVIKDDWFLHIDYNISSNDPLFTKLKKIYTKKVSDHNTIEIYTNDM